MTYDPKLAAELVAQAMENDRSPITQCESFDGMSNTRCAFVSGHSGDHLHSHRDESDEIRLKLLRDNRDRREPLVHSMAEQLAAAMAEVERMRPACDAAVVFGSELPTIPTPRRGNTQ